MSLFKKFEEKPAAGNRLYIKSGIGGIGNFHRTSGAIPIPVAPRITTTQSSGVFSTGIGGAGNSRTSKDRKTITPEEVLSRRSIQQDRAARNYHHGIGGAGNRASSNSNGSLSTSLASSASSGASTRRLSGVGRLQEKFDNSKTSLLQAWQRTPADSVSLSSSASLSEKV
jgi:hypothetical protein